MMKKVKQNKAEFKCIYEFENVYLNLVYSIGFFYMAILMVLIMITENIFGITVALCVVFVITSIIFLIVSLLSRDKKFIINQDECKVESKKGILYKIPLQSIKRIVDLDTRYGKRYIIFDCEEYPFLAGQDIFFHRILYIKYTSHRLREIRKFCSHCRIDKERTNFYDVTKKRDEWTILGKWWHCTISINIFNRASCFQEAFVL